MAKPIKETPILTGKDAKEFINNINKAKGIKISEQEKARIMQNYEKLKSICVF